MATNVRIFSLKSGDSEALLERFNEQGFHCVRSYKVKMVRDNVVLKSRIG